ncbi:unnamed protein product [Peronospora destructor]|uniref:Uncharacterized protein n=1 Tax=Peronospora destructor TaxID=86335 RepID=A0AAV0UF00_9STRA|nr:unnamed protein product [Peronospora destructor]
MDAIRQRHDDALEQIGAKAQHAIVRSKSGAELRLNQTVPKYTGAAIRPDIVVREKRAVLYLDSALSVFKTSFCRACDVRCGPLPTPTRRSRGRTAPLTLAMLTAVPAPNAMACTDTEAR